MNEIRFTDEAPTMDPDKPVRCLWYVLFQTRTWGGELDPHIASQGPYEDRDGAQKMARLQQSYGNHILALVPAIFQDGDYIEDYKPYEEPKPLGHDSRDVIEAIQMYDRNRYEGNRVQEYLVQPVGPVDHIEFRAARMPDEQAFRNALHGLLQQPAPPPVVVRPGDGIKKALEAKVDGIRRSARIQDQIPARDTTYRGLRAKGAPISVSSKSWTGRGKR